MSTIIAILFLTASPFCASFSISTSLRPSSTVSYFAAASSSSSTSPTVLFAQTRRQRTGRTSRSNHGRQQRRPSSEAKQHKHDLAANNVNRRRNKSSSSSSNVATLTQHRPEASLHLEPQQQEEQQERPLLPITSSMSRQQQQQQQHKQLPGRRNNVHTQFKSRHVKYEEERLHGIMATAHASSGHDRSDVFVPMSNNNATTAASARPSKRERQLLTKQISLLLHEEEEDDGDDRASSLDTNNVADRQTVFGKLSDEEKNRASFAVSKVATAGTAETTSTSSSSSSPASVLLQEPVRSISSGKSATRTKKQKVRANVLETGHDTMKQYVKSLGQHQVLSPEDEAVLGRQIQILNSWEEKRQRLEETLLRAPTFQEWAQELDTAVPELKRQIRRSQKAKAALIEANLRLVVTVARQTVKRGRSEINFEDACQEGILGLTRATEKFDPTRGFRFSSYAVWWIKKMIHQNVSEQSRQVRLPARVMRKINDIRIFEKVLQDELGRKPRDDEVAEKVGITVEQLDFYRRSANDVMSLDKKVKFTKESDNTSNAPTMNDMVKDPSLSPVDLAQKQMLKEDVGRLILTLSPREQAVIRLRFGLDNGSPKTLAQIGTKFSVDKEVIRKIEAKALRKLRQPYRNQSLKCYVTDL